MSSISSPIYYSKSVLTVVLQLASEGIKKDFTQSLFDSANYTLEVKNGTELVRKMKEELEDYFSSKKQAAQVKKICAFFHLFTKKTAALTAQPTYIPHRKLPTKL